MQICGSVRNFIPKKLQKRSITNTERSKEAFWSELMPAYTNSHHIRQESRISVVPPIASLTDGNLQAPTRKMTQSELEEFVFPVDIAVKIVSSLELFDICSLGSCSQYWEEVCGADYVWERLSKDRWPDTDLEKEFSEYESQSHELDQSIHPNMKGWRGFYRMKHEDMAWKANSIADYLKKQELSFESVDCGNYMKATEDLQAMHFSFKDVVLLLFKRKFNVLVNLVALHYCIMQLDLPAEHVKKAMRSHNIEERRVFIQWNKLRGRIGLFSCPDKLHYVNLSLEDLAKSAGGVFLLLQRGVYNNWLQIQISAA